MFFKAFARLSPCLLLALTQLQGCDRTENSVAPADSIQTPMEQVAAREIYSMPVFEPLPSDVFHRTTNQLPAYHVNTTIFSAYAETQAQLFAQQQVDEYVNGMSAGTRQYVREAKVNSVKIDLNTGKVEAQVSVRLGKQALLMWDYGVNAKINMQLIQKEDYSDFGLLFESVVPGTTDGKLDWIVDAFLTPVAFASFINGKFANVRYWVRSGLQSTSDPYNVADRYQQNMGNFLVWEGSPLAGFANTLTGSFSYQGSMVPGRINVTVYCTSFDLAAGVAKFLVRPTLWLTVNGTQKQIMMGRFELVLDIYAQPIKDHYAEIMRSVTWYYYLTGNGCAIAGGSGPQPVLGLDPSYCSVPEKGSNYNSVSQAYLSNPWRVFGGTKTVNFWIKVSSLTSQGTPWGDAQYLQPVLDKLVQAYGVKYAAKIEGISF